MIIIQALADVSLWSASLSAPVVGVAWSTTIGDRAFTVAGPRAWNSQYHTSLL